MFCVLPLNKSEADFGLLPGEEPNALSNGGRFCLSACKDLARLKNKCLVKMISSLTFLKAQETGLSIAVHGYRL